MVTLSLVTRQTELLSAAGEEAVLHFLVLTLFASLVLPSLYSSFQATYLFEGFV